jgi:hypothetical protein
MIPANNFCFRAGLLLLMALGLCLTINTAQSTA